MRKFTSCLIGAILSFSTLLLMLSMLRASIEVGSNFDSASDLMFWIYNIVVIVALTVIFIKCIIGCAKHKKKSQLALKSFQTSFWLIQKAFT